MLYNDNSSFSVEYGMVSIYSANYILQAYCVAGFILGPGIRVVDIIQEAIAIAQVRADRGLKASGIGYKSNIMVQLMRVAIKWLGSESSCLIFEEIDAW